MREAALELFARIAMTDAAPEHIKARARAIIEREAFYDALRGVFNR